MSIPNAVGLDSIAKLSLEQLMRRVSRGDEAAFSELYDHSVSQVLDLIRHILTDDTHAFDVVQKVFLDVWRNAPRYDGSLGMPMAWILAVAHREATDAM